MNTFEIENELAILAGYRTRTAELEKQHAALLEVLKDILRENHELGAISKPTADQARSVIARIAQ